MLNRGDVCGMLRKMLTITDKAQEMLGEFADSADEGVELILRVEIVGRGPKGFQYDLQFVGREDAKEDDIELDIDGMSVLVAARSAQYLEGTTLDYKETLMGGGFSFDNPNPLWVDELSKAVAEIIASEVNPVVASHGGHVDLVGVDDGKAIIAFGGGCQGCGMVDVTLKQGVEVMIKDNVPGISEVIDATDHAAGTNPFY
jgi:Fe/S biogenesis protein NfuA|tara:strand:- start:2232 stop:2834 length:603 start_codon:yes stop_codon:yes gene_type:complete